MKSKIKGAIAAMAAVTLAFTLSACDSFSAWGDEINRAWNGVSAEMTTYTQAGQRIDQVHGKSFRVSRDDRFDGSNSDGSSKEDSQVLLISIGDKHISHVGSTMIMKQDGLQNIMTASNSHVEITNKQAGTPWLNDLKEKHRNLWHAKAKTVLIRSQDGTPVAVYAGNSVSIYKTDVPKSTWFRIDGKYLLVYRADYTVYDSDLLG